LFCQDARLQSSNRRIDAGILFLSTTVEEQKDQGNNDQHCDNRQTAKPKRPALFVDCLHHLLGCVSIFLGKAQPLAKLLHNRLIPQLHTHP
jgi:hypothetical protein